MGRVSAVMKGMRFAAIVAVAITLAAPAHADGDTDFANQLHTYGLYGQRDYNAWQFFASAISYHCPDQASVLENVAAQGR
jgi:hypothetical protein